MENYFMKEALKEAQIAYDLAEVPVGAIIVKDGNIIARAHNLRETLKDTTAHAEIIAIKEASKAINNWRLNGCDLYVTLEPCPMCAGAIVQSRIRRLYIGAVDFNMGACGSILNVAQNDRLNFFTDIKWTLDDECSLILKKFFKSKR